MTQLPGFKGRKSKRVAREPFTSEEGAFIVKWAPVFGYAPVAAAIGTTPKAVSDFCKEAGIDPWEPEYTAREIAERLGLTRDQVNRAYYSGMKKLRKLLDEDLLKE